MNGIPKVLHGRIHEVVGRYDADYASASLGARCIVAESCLRARDTRALIVPTGTAQINAASS